MSQLKRLLGQNFCIASEKHIGYRLDAHNCPSNIQDLLNNLAACCSTEFLSPKKIFIFFTNFTILFWSVKSEHSAFKRPIQFWERSQWVDFYFSDIIKESWTRSAGCTYQRLLFLALIGFTFVCFGTYFRHQTRNHH